MEILQKLLPMQPLASTEGAQLDLLMYLIHGVILLLFVGWGIYFIVVLFKFKQSSNPKVKDSSEKVHHISSAVEWTVVAIEFFLLFVFSIPFWAYNIASIPEGKDLLEIKVVAQQFAWNVHYAGPDGKFGKASAKFLEDNAMGLDPDDPNLKDDITTMNQIYVPVGQTVLIRLTSKDVIHSIGIPAMRVKQDIIPGMSTFVWFTPNKLGQYDIVCSQLCGLGHYRMRALLNVLPKAEYDDWIQQMKGIHD
jgi:cytochrome c oxidase subunit 2